MDIDNIEEFLTIEKRINAADDQHVDIDRVSIRDRWEFGGLMVAKRKVNAKQLPTGLLAALGKTTGLGRAELKYRAQFADRYPTEGEVANALATFSSWRQVIKSLPKPSRATKPKAKPSTPKRHDRHDEIAALSKQGLSQREIADETGVDIHLVRRIVERDNVEQQVRAEVKAELELERKRIQKMRDDARRVLDARKGTITKGDYDLIRSCLHPDSRMSVTPEKLARAFRIINESEILLLNEKDCPTNTLPAFEDLKKVRRA